MAKYAFYNICCQQHYAGQPARLQTRNHEPRPSGFWTGHRQDACWLTGQFDDLGRAIDFRQAAGFTTLTIWMFV